MSTLQRFSYRTWFTLAGLAAPIAVAGQDFGGDIPSIPGTPSAEGTDIRQFIVNVISYVLNFLALAAVVVIIIAGIRLVVSQGNEEQKNTAKKTIIYVIAGLIVILFARVIVGFFTETVPSEI